VLTPRALELGEVAVEAAAPPVTQKADTTEFSARSFKTHPDATAEDLLAKMPGISIRNGTVTSNGETVQQVLVDGKPFFGGDPTLAIRNLPADVIDKIQVFDKLSDQAEFTGFDDGQSQKTINLMLRPDRRNSQFGKVYGGVGGEGQYLTGGNDNVMTTYASLVDRALEQRESAELLSAGSARRPEHFGAAQRPFGGGSGRRRRWRAWSRCRRDRRWWRRLRRRSGRGANGAGSLLVRQQDGIT
jgi:hypothetical protein